MIATPTTSTIIPKVVKYLTKATGIVGLGLVGYDAHYLGKVQADLYASEKDAKASAYYLNNSMYLSNMSKVQEKVKDLAYDVELDQTWRRFFNEGIGYIKGFGSMLANHVIPFGLSLGALLFKGVPAKISAGALAVYGGFQFIKNFFGIGTPPGLTK